MKEVRVPEVLSLVHSFGRVGSARGTPVEDGLGEFLTRYERVLFRECIRTFLARRARTISAADTKLAP